MIKNTTIATVLGIALMAGCAGGSGSQVQALATDDFGDRSEVCYHTSGDYQGDLVPPAITISIGESEISATDAMVLAQTDDREGYSRLLAEFVTAQVSIDEGASIDGDDIDALIAAEDMLVRLDREERPLGFFDVDTAGLIATLGELNEGFRIEAPCMNTDNAGVFEVDAPASDSRPEHTNPRWHQVLVGASAEEVNPNVSDSRPLSDYATTWEKVVVGASTEDSDSGPERDFFR